MTEDGEDRKAFKNEMSAEVQRRMLANDTKGTAIEDFVADFMSHR